VALGCALFAGNTTVAWVALALAAACAGFLPFNLPPARIFLGDVGSGALGYLLAALAAFALARDPWKGSLLLLPLSAFLTDATLTLGRRVLRGERWWLPHTQHAYQQWMRRQGSHGRVSAAYAAWTALMLVNAKLASSSGSTGKMLALAACYLAGATTWTWLQRTPHPFGDRE
jgi:UDP-N-acetylmuramyl pentapeptide phosphotransferase/UDP-N-acetylglucosamine-1-phosphate transferase